MSSIKSVRVSEWECFADNNDFSEIKLLPENKATEQFFVEVSIFRIKGNLEVVISIKQIWF